jgi:uncharacterized phage infection (PIP) family protein YhgE
MEDLEKLIKEIDDNFIGIKEGFDDNAKAHGHLNDALKQLDDAIMGLHERLSAVEIRLSEIATPDKILYKPKGADDYLDMKGNYDHIYERISKLEDKQ